MARIKNIRVEYYQVTVSDKLGKKKEQRYDLRELIKKADELGLEARTFPYYEENARLDQFP